MSDVQEQLEAARAAREAKLEQRKAADEDAARELADLQKLEELEDEYGLEGEGVARVKGRHLTVFVKRPHRNTFSKFIEKDKPDSKDIKQFVWPCIVHPDKSAVDAAIDEEPYLLLRLANAVAQLGGVGEAALAGK